MPALSSEHLSFPQDIASVPASTRTSYTHVDMSRPRTPAGFDLDPNHNVEEAPEDYRPYHVEEVDAEIEDQHGATYDDMATPRPPARPTPDAIRETPASPAPPLLPAPASLPVPQTPQASITFLLVSGKRRTMLFDPDTTVGRVKELVWNTWPNDWQDERPAAPFYFRILYLGKILQDEDTIAQLKIPTHTASSIPISTIVHLSVRSIPPPTNGADKKKGWGRSGDSEASDGVCCSCCIIC